MRQRWVPLWFSKTNPAGLAAGSRWSARVEEAEHRVNAHQTLHPEGVPEPLAACLRLSLDMGWFLPAPARVWHTSGMQAALARVSGGRFLSGPETTTGYRLPTLPGWTEMIRALVSGLRIPAELLLGEPGRAAVQERLLRQSARKGDAFHHAVMIALLRKEGRAAQRLDRPGASVATQKTLS